MRSRWLWILIGLPISAILVSLAVVAWQVISVAQTSAVSAADAAVVLGAAAWGNLPSPVYRERINEAIALYQQGRVRSIIFTGGTPEPGYPSEAEVGRQFALRHGVAATAILVDGVSRNTWQNLERARGLMAAAHIHCVLLVSDPLHLRRALAMASDLGLCAAPAPTPSSRFQSWSTRGRFLWRETWLTLDYLVFGHPS